MSALPYNKKTDIISRSFAVTSLVSAFNPLIGLLTSVYYAENHIVIQEGRVDPVLLNRNIAWFCAVVFAVLFGAFLFVQFPVAEINKWVLLAVSPVLFCLGIRLTARALFEDAREDKDLIFEDLKNTLSRRGVL